MSGKNYGSGGCGCGGGGSRSKGIIATGAARTGYHAKARAAGQAASGGTSGGCGCGGSCNGDCGCAGGSCGCNPGVLVQPTFFAGQLLTDDDLQALTNYVVTKQRLHNRFLVGSGVACGLVVNCHPCGGGRVIVQPGYAVDCCGNEILVPCAIELDINAMVRALKISIQGQDCGDPCAKPVKDPTPAPSGAPVAAGQAATTDANGDDKATGRARCYCLYIEYCEEPGELVAPYSQDDSCAVTCKPSRLHEGFTFELRCPADDPEPPSFLDRLKCCIGDLREADHQSEKIERSQAYMQLNERGLAAFNKHEATPAFEDADATLITEAKTTFRNLVDAFKKEGAAAQETTEEIAFSQQQILRKALDELHAVGAATARFNLMSEDDRTKRKDSQQVQAAITENGSALNKAAPEINEQVCKLLSSPFERTVARSIVDETIKYSDPNLSKTDRNSQQAYAFAFGGLATSAANVQAHRSLGDFKAWLLRKIDECPPTGQCCLEAEIMAIQVPTGEDVTFVSSRAAEKLVRALIRYLLDCICAALLPPCPTCDDPAVKLACLQIDGCKVCEICNLERPFLLTEHNLRYWIPLLHSFGEALERLCCDFADRFRIRTRPQPVGPTEFVRRNNQTAFFQSGSQLGEQAASKQVFPTLVRLTGLDLGDVRSTLNIGGNFARATARDPVMTALAARYTDLDAARLVGGKAVDVVRKEVEHATDGLQKQFEARFQDAADELGNARVILDLQEQLRAQAARIETLESKLEYKRKPS